jgi:hypothetical protein
MFHGLSHIDRKRGDLYVGHEESTGVEWYVWLRFGRWVAKRTAMPVPSLFGETLAEINAKLARL